MYEIIKGGMTIAALDRLRYIKKASNGCFVFASYDTAQGIVVNGTPYNLMGREPMEGLETVFVVESDNVASPEDTKLLGQEITAMELESLAQGQKQTAMELDLLGQGQYITDIELEGLKHV